MLTNESLKYLRHLKINNPTTSVYLNKLFTEFENHKYNYDEPDISHVKIKKPAFNKYIATKLKQKVKKYKNTISVKWLVKTQFKIDCNLYIHSKNKKKSINEKTLNLLVYIISFTASLSSKDKQFDIHVVLLPDKKFFLTKFTTNEVNTGVTSYDNNSATVLVYRKEECIKVIIHEIIHGLGLSDIEDTGTVIDHYNDKYNINCSKINLNETYTEIWAKLINCYLVTKINGRLMDNRYKYFCYLIDSEKMFSSIQATKIINLLKKKGKLDLNKHTSIVGYYLAINELINNLDAFLKMKFNDNNLFYLDTESRFNNLMTSIDKYYTEKVKNVFNKTFRMTAVELKI